MNIPLHVLLRRKFSEYLNKFLGLFVNNKNVQQVVNKEKINSILIVRPNYRIGNILFLTPLINELAKYLPNAQIDIIVGLKIAGDILEPMPNVDKIINIPRKILLHPIQIYHYIKQTRKKKYDIVLNTSGGSVSSQIITALVKAKYKANFASPKLWTNYTHIIERGELTHIHMGLEILEYLRFFNITVPKEPLSLDIKLTDTEIKAGENALQTLLKENNIQKNTLVIAIFRNARFDKKIKDEWWIQCIKQLYLNNPNIIIIDILSPDIPTKLSDNVLAYSHKNLRLLGSFFRACDLYISADTGPMHLAVASHAKVLALFNKTHIDLFGALGNGNRTIEVDNYSIDDIVKITQDSIA